MKRRIDKDERVGSNSWPSSEFHDHDRSEVSNCPFPSPSPPQQQQQQQQQRRKNNKDDDACFACQQKGHWAKDCPTNQKNKNTTTTVTTTATTSTTTNTGDDADYQDGPTVDLMCPCGAGCCNILTSKTARNPNRIFYRCPLYRPKACKFFMWCDELFLITGPPPPCPCGAGLCCVGIQNHDQQNRKHPSPSYLFVCPIKKGQGACNFIQPVVAATYSKGEASMSSITSSPKSPLTHCFSDDTATRQSPSSSSITISDKIKVEDESSDISFQESESKSSASGTPKQPPVQLETSCRVPWDDEMRMLMNFQELKEDIPGEKKEEEVGESPLRRHHKHLQDGNPKNDDVFINDSHFDHNCGILAADLEEVPCMDTLAIRASVSVLTPGRVLVQHQQQRQAEFFSKISSAAEPTNLLRGVFPSFDPIFVPGDDNGSGTESNKLTDDCGQLLGGGIVKWGPCSDGVDQSPSRKITPMNNNNNAMTLSILDVFKQVAARLEEGFLDVLESMQCHEHKSMFREAHLLFNALDNLSVADYHSFKECVMGFIGCAVTLSELESSSPISKESCIEQEVVDKHSRLQTESEDICSQCSEASSALTAYLNFLMQEEAWMKEMLRNIRAEILCCQADKEEISSWLDKMTQEKHKSELSVQAAKEALRLRQQRAVQLDVAKASFELARSKLRDR